MYLTCKVAGGDLVCEVCQARRVPGFVEHGRSEHLVVFNKSLYDSITQSIMHDRRDAGVERVDGSHDGERSLSGLTSSLSGLTSSPSGLISSPSGLISNALLCRSGLRGPVRLLCALLPLDALLFLQSDVLVDARHKYE